MTVDSFPLLSVLMPIRNEADFIQQALGSVLANDYPPDRMEVLVIDGMSNDATRSIVQSIAARDGRVRLLDNPRRIAPFAMNIGLRAMKGELFTRIDGHATVAPDFLSQSVRCLNEHPEAWLVGGPIETVADGFIGRAIAGAMQSPVGVGNAMFRLAGYEGWVDTLAFGTHHKWVIDRIGPFDEQLVRNQDDEFNLRVIKGGGRIWLSPSIRSRYYSRSSLSKLWKQYYQYGFWRIRTMQKHRQVASIRQAVPMLFVLSLGILAALSLVWPIFMWLLAEEVGLYALGLLAGAAGVARKSGLGCAALSPMIFAILHFGYGLGCLWGIVRFLCLRGAGMPKPETIQLSR